MSRRYLDLYKLNTRANEQIAQIERKQVPTLFQSARRFLFPTNPIGYSCSSPGNCSGGRNRTPDGGDVYQGTKGPVNIVMGNPNVTSGGGNIPVQGSFVNGGVQFPREGYVNPQTLGPGIPSSSSAIVGDGKAQGTPTSCPACALGASGGGSGAGTGSNTGNGTGGVSGVPTGAGGCSKWVLGPDGRTMIRDPHCQDVPG